jgi:hypothetical protein
MMRFWPATDPVQLEYELLREMALAEHAWLDQRRSASNSAVW